MRSTQGCLVQPRETQQRRQKRQRRRQKRQQRRQKRQQRLLGLARGSGDARSLSRPSPAQATPSRVAPSYTQHAGLRLILMKRGIGSIKRLIDLNIRRLQACVLRATPDAIKARQLHDASPVKARQRPAGPGQPSPSSRTLQRGGGGSPRSSGHPIPCSSSRLPGLAYPYSWTRAPARMCTVLALRGLAAWHSLRGQSG